MARPKRINDYRAVRSELTSGDEISVRNFQYLKDNSLWPFDVDRREVEREIGLYGDESVAELGLISGFVISGLSLRAAARAAYWFSFDSGHAHQPQMFSRFADLFDQNTRIQLLDSGYVPTLLRQEKTHGARARWQTPNRNDALIFIADKRFVFQGYHEPQLSTFKTPAQKKLGVRPDSPEPFGWIDGWKGRNDPEFTHVSERYSFDPIADEDGYYTDQPTLYDHASLDFQTAFDNACGLIKTNLSLAVRRMFDQIVEARM